MIITVALNPAVDQTVEVDHFAPGDTNRVISIRWDIGGKGINVARVLKELGYEALATGFAPGPQGRMIEDQLADSGIGCDFVYVPGDTRTNITILERSTHTHTQLALSGPTLPADAPSQLLDRLKRRVRNDTWLALAGSIPPPGDPQVYVDLIAMAAERGGRTALDADGPVVEAVLHSGVRPTLLKLNRLEISRLLHREVQTAEEVLAGARAIHARGVPYVVVTMSKEGAIAVTPDAEYRVHVPPVEIVSAVGAGDAFLSGLLCGLVREGDWTAALALAAAASTAACLTPGTVLCAGPEVERLRPLVAVERIREHSLAR
ncbi:MAG TPA: 1-phosphofructokinase family hexose kinase [Dehalococcoidia bacterium]|nr:1-phosphofructokinase family hexose kinase [Dehalococcoidia bacterium]